MIDEKSRHVEQAGHPGDDGDDMQRLGPEIEIIRVPKIKTAEDEDGDGKGRHRPEARPAAETGIGLLDHAELP